MENSEFIKRFEVARDARTTVQGMWDDVERYVTPYRGKFFQEATGEHAVEWTRFGSDYDSTPVMAHQNLAASMHGSLTSPSLRWYDMRFRNKKLRKDKKASTWIENVSEQIYFELQDSNFNLEINETYQDMVGFGSSFLSLEEEPGANDWNGLQFTSVPLKEGYFEPDHRGRILRFYRDLRWTPAQIISKFGPEGVPKSIVELDKKGSTDKLDVIFCIYPKNNRILKWGEKLSPSRRPWSFHYILKKGAETLGKVGGQYEMSAYCPRWRKTSESIWGHSPAMLAMGSIKSLNTAFKMMLVGSEKRIDPAMLAEERAILTDLNLPAGSLSVVRDINGIKPLDSGYDIYVNEAVITKLQDQVKEFFYSQDLNFPQAQGTPMSATEAQIRYEIMQRLLGPTAGRIESDLLTPIVSRSFMMMMRAGVIEKPPEIVQELNSDFDIEYIGPLARAQRTERATSIERFISIGGSIAAVKPDVLDNIDFDECIRQIGRDLSVPASGMTDEKKMETAREERKTEEDAMKTAAIAEQQGNASEAISNAQVAENA